MIDRCGVIAGPWQMGKVDQGVFTFWMLAHHFGRPLSYIGFGGQGKQVRDLLHVEDLLALLDEQLSDPGRWDGIVANVGGGHDVQSVAARDHRAVRARSPGAASRSPASRTPVRGTFPATCRTAASSSSLTDWRPARSPGEILSDIHGWICEHEDDLARALY